MTAGTAMGPYVPFSYMVFTVSRPLLNPHFEGYKLSVSTPPKLAQVPLEHKATQSRAGKHALGFEEVASRVRHNHLAVGDSTDSAVYVAEDGSVVLVLAEDDSNLDNIREQSGISLRTVFKLPTPTVLPDRPTEYPGAAHVVQDIWLISDGSGCAYLLHIPRSPAIGQVFSSVLAIWQLRLDENPIPFQLHTAELVEPGAVCAILSSSSRISPSSPTVKSQSIVDIWGVRISLPDLPCDGPISEAAFPIRFEVAWRRRGDHIPVFVKYISTHNAFLLLGGSSYRNVTSIMQSQYEPTPDEAAPIPRIDESLETLTPPPYSWTQTNDSVTVAFALPTSTSTSDIAVTFGSQSLSLQAGNPPLAKPHYTAAPLWGIIHPSTSVWTWERGEGNMAGLLSLHLDKMHPGTRWSHVFAQGFEADVSETLDPSELAAIRESLEKFTSALPEGPSGLGSGLPSLSTGERDDELDSDVGMSVMLTWVQADGDARAPIDDAPAVLLSLPLPGIEGPLTLVVKNDIDGVLFTLDNSYAWLHTATYAALAFVLASKRDKRFTYHISSTVAFAFESGAHRDGGGNVYSYHGSVPGDKKAKQSVFQIPPGAGALLGVGAIISKAGQKILLCLTEHELTVCRHVY